MEIAGNTVTGHLAPPVAGWARSSASAHADLLARSVLPSKVSMKTRPSTGGPALPARRRRRISGVASVSMNSAKEGNRWRYAK